MTSLSELAAQISVHAKTIEETLTARDLPSPSFAAGGPAGLPAGAEYRELRKARNALIDAARSIEHLATGPEQWMKSQTMMVRLSILPSFPKILEAKAAVWLIENIEADKS